jgi:hypothetical protein
MVTTFTLIVGHDRWQAAQLDLTPQSVNDPKHVFQSQGGFACLKVDDEAHTNPRREGQLGLCQPELLASGAQCFAELLR